MDVGMKISQLRKLSGMTQEQLAEKLSVSRQTISKWETGITSPDLESIVKISKIFQVSLDELLLEGRTAASEEKLTLEDLVKMNLYNRRMTLLLISGLIFLMVSVMTAVFVTAIRSTTISTQYMLYRYIVVGEYANAPVDYEKFFLPAIGAGIVGAVLCLGYAIGIKTGGKLQFNKKGKL
ncbi:MAG: helix-turn-helix transcriptional regulator [Eubacteriales bacterium]|nr:helix-turn-helix transcriptional regulator [Eubacteriales bacterium]